jgi:hypothetical protein
VAKNYCLTVGCERDVPPSSPRQYCCDHCQASGCTIHSQACQVREAESK